MKKGPWVSATIGRVQIQPPKVTAFDHRVVRPVKKHPRKKKGKA